MYHEWKLMGLEEMIHNVEAKKDYSDIQAMHSGLNSRFNFFPSSPTRDRVYDELSNLIAVEEYELVDTAMQIYQ